MTAIELNQLLSKYSLKPNKQLGQHYLIDETILAEIVRLAEIKPAELIVEIGAGPGILTSQLASAGADVLAIEFDREFCRLLQAEFHNWRNVHILSDDALRIDFSQLQKDGQPYRKIVANIPYQITNPLIRKILSPNSPIETAVLMIQSEVADRLTALPGSSERGLLTVMIEYYGKVSKLIDVPATAFWPSPKVKSAVVKIERTLRPNLSEGSKAKSSLVLADEKLEQAFFWLVKQGLSSKRKTLVNSLAASLQQTKNESTAIVEEAGINLMARAEDLTLAQWLNLFSVYEKRQK